MFVKIVLLLFLVSHHAYRRHKLKTTHLLIHLKKDDQLGGTISTKGLFTISELIGSISSKFINQMLYKNYHRYFIITLNYIVDILQ